MVFRGRKILEEEKFDRKSMYSIVQLEISDPFEDFAGAVQL